MLEDLTQTTRNAPRKGKAKLNDKSNLKKATNRSLPIIYFIARSIMNYLLELAVLVEEQKPNIICVTER